MKVLLFTREYPPHVYGGAGVHVEYLTRELVRHLEVEVRCFGDQQIAEQGFMVRGFGLGHSGYQCPPSLVPVLEAAQRCLDMNAAGVTGDLVHCHTWYTHLAGIIAKLCYKTPLILTMHSLEPQRPWKSAQLGHGYRFSSWVERTAIQMADATIAVSNRMRSDILDLFDADAARVHVIHNGIDTDEFSPRPSRAVLQRYGIDPEIPYVLFVGRMTEQKGIRHLLRSLAAMDSGFQVVLCVGAADTPEFAAEMRSLAAAAAARRNGVVWIEEMVDRPALIGLYSSASIFCCPSIYEPFGIINLEAMACGTAIVAAGTGGIPEIVLEGETGFLVPLETKDGESGPVLDSAKYERGLADRINRLMADRELRLRFGRAGRNRAAATFSWAGIAEATARLYRNVLRSAPGNRDL
jgi:starch synthase